MQSNALTVLDYLNEHSADRREVLSELLDTIRANIQPGFDETMRWGMISFEVPLQVSGPTYNSQPLGYLAIAAQKNHFSLYLYSVYMNLEVEQEFRRRWTKEGLKLDIGKACVRFKNLAGADLETIAWAAGLHSPAEYLEQYNQLRSIR
jgi:hypothetical protein